MFLGENIYWYLYLSLKNGMKMVLMQLCYKVSTKLLVCSFLKQISNLLVIKQEEPVQHAEGGKSQRITNVINLR